MHKNLGPGLLESAYEACIAFELIQLGFKVETQKSLPLIYKQVSLACGYRLDILVQDKVIIEVKAVEKLLPIHEVQLVSYLKLTGCKVGLLINFNVKVLTDGLTRKVNNFPD